MTEILICTYVVEDEEQYANEWPAEEKVPEEIKTKGWNGRTIEAEHSYEDGTFQSKFWSPGSLKDMIHRNIIRPKTIDDSRV